MVERINYFLLSQQEHQPCWSAIPVLADAIGFMGRGPAMKKDKTPEFEPPEESGGFEEEDTSTTIVTPFDPTLIRIETQNPSIDLILKRIQYKEINLAPDFQRKSGIWTDQAQSRLIESIFIRIPLPAFYMDGTDDDRWVVVDGLQRLTALRRFVLDKELRLDGLQFLTNFEDANFDDLPRPFQRRILETQLTVFVIKEGTPERVKFDIFQRINTGGMPLSAQEIRHVLNQGPATKFLAQLAESEEFKRATDHSIRDDRMGDRECVLRCLAFLLTPFEEYTGKTDFDGFLNDAMATLNGLSPLRRRKLGQQFLRGMSIAHELFGPDAFRKRYSSYSRRWPINKALLESWNVNLTHLSDAEVAILVERRELLQKRFVKLMQQRAFDNAVSQGTGDVRKVQIRFSSIKQLIQEVLQ